MVRERGENKNAPISSHEKTGLLGKEALHFVTQVPLRSQPPSRHKREEVEAERKEQGLHIGEKSEHFFGKIKLVF